MRCCLSWLRHKLPMFHAGITTMQPHAAPQCPPTTFAPPTSLLHTKPCRTPARPPSPFTHLPPTCPFAHLARTRLTQPSAGVASGTDCADCPVMRLQESSYAMHHKQVVPGHGSVGEVQSRTNWDPVWTGPNPAVPVQVWDFPENTRPLGLRSGHSHIA